MSKVLLTQLGELEQALVELDLWTELPPSEEAMQSIEPFAVDTMAFNQWLQWIFIPRLRALVEASAVLPQGSDVATMAEYWCGLKCLQGNRLIQAVEAIDATLNTDP